MICIHCKKPIEDDSQFCRHCGGAQSDEQPPAATPWQQPTPLTDETPARPAGMATSLKVALGCLGVLAAVGLAHVASGPGTGTAPSQHADAAAPIPDTPALASADAGTAPDAGTKWTYSDKTDKLRGDTTYFASTTSTNTIRQDPPYDPDTTMQILLRYSPTNENEVILTISSGQMMCPSFQGCSGSVRFDDDPPQEVRLDGPSDNSSQTVFVTGAKAFIAKLRKAKHVVIEKTLYQAGNPQFEFDVAGLQWDH